MVAASSGNIATPMLKVTLNSVPWISIGFSHAAMILAATSRAAGASGMSGSSTTNSSPPQRARVSPERTQSRSVRDRVTSTWSPSEWPKWSLTYLKWSTSMNATATWRLLRSAIRMAVPQRSSRRTRLGRPVSASCSAMWLMCFSSR